MPSSRRMEAQDAIDTVEGLAGFTGRGAGTDAERRAANWLAERLRAAGLEAEVQTFWSRPNRAAAQLWHVALAIVGSLVALASPVAGIVVLAIALVSVIADELAGVSPGRRLTPERASQNVIATRPAATETTASSTHLLLTANYDAGRAGLAYRLRPITARLTRATRGFTPGWLGWITLALVWLLVLAILRDAGHTSQAVGALQLPPTVGLLLGFALLLETATSDWSPAAGDDASGVAATLAVANALAASPPRHLELTLVLTGSGDPEQLGLRRHLASRRSDARRRPGARGRMRPGSWVRPRSRRARADTIVLGIAASGGGLPRWWHSDGPLLPLRYSASLRRIASQVAEDEAFLQAEPHRSRGSSPALPARTAGLPALTIGCLERDGLPPRSHQKNDTADSVDPQAIERTVQFALLLIDAIDITVGESQSRSSATPA